MTIQAQQLQTREALAEPLRMSWELFLKWADGNARVEWVNGEVIEAVVNTAQHQLIMKFLLRYFDTYLEARPIGRAYPPMMMRLPEKPSGREPDVLLVLNEHADRMKGTYLEGPADLAVEIVSKDSEERDRGDKFFEYEAAGVAEYWLIDPLRDEMALYILGEDKRYHRAERDANGYLHSVVAPGLAVKPAWFWGIEALDVKAVVRTLEQRLGQEA